MTQTIRNLLCKLLAPHVWPFFAGFVCGGFLVWVLFVLVR